MDECMAIMAFFRDSMPVFWQPQRFRPSPHELELPLPRSKRQRVLPTDEASSTWDGLGGTDTREVSLSSAIEGWLPPFFLPAHKTLRDQVAKLHAILLVLCRNQDLLGFDILSVQSQARYEKFLHMWCCVNTRCFYYVPPGSKAPKDPNEAMALVPFLDLFNHTTDGEGAEVKYGKDGFDVVADRDYAAGEEIHIQYGSHSNDALWIEYGFMLDNNSHDEIDIDQLIVKGLSEEQKEMLMSTNYMGEYTFNTSEVNYRTETVAWLACGALSCKQWEDMVLGLFDPEDESRKKYQQMRLSMKSQIVRWLVAAKEACERNLTKLSPIKENIGNHLSLLVPSTDLLASEYAEGETPRLRIASSRLEMCLFRWRQIYALCIFALENIAREYPSAMGDSAVERRRILHNVLT